MATQMIIRIDETLEEKAARIAKTEGRSLSEVIRNLLEKYIIEKDFASAMDGIWSRARIKMEAKGFTKSDIARVIKDVRGDVK